VPLKISGSETIILDFIFNFLFISFAAYLRHFVIKVAYFFIDISFYELYLLTNITKKRLKKEKVIFGIIRRMLCLLLLLWMLGWRRNLGWGRAEIANGEENV